MPRTCSAVLHNGTGGTITGKTILWSTTAEPTIATIDPYTGVLTVKADGTFEVIASCEGRSGSTTVTVSLSVTPASITVTPNPVSISEGTTAQLVPVVRNAVGTILPGATVTYAPLDATHDTVSGSGLITGVLATSGAGAGVRVTSGAIHVDVPVTVTGAIAQLVADFNALTAAGATQDVPAGNVIMGWDTKYGPAPTLVSGGTLYSTQDPAYVAGGEPSLTMHGGVDSVTDWGTPSWDAVLQEVNSLTGSTAGVIRTIASAALNMATRPMTFWVLTTGHNSKPSANGSLGSVRAAASDLGFGGETGLSLRFTDSVANGKYYPQVLYHNNASGKEGAAESLIDTTTVEATRLLYFGVDATTKHMWVGGMGDLWVEWLLTNSDAALTVDNVAARFWPFGIDHQRYLGAWVTQGKPTPAQVSRMQTFAGGVRNTYKVTNTQALIDGNSFLAGEGSSDYAHSLAGLLDAATTADVVNYAVDGISWSQMTANAPNGIYRRYNADRAAQHILIGEWTNDYSGADGTANWLLGRDYIRAMKLKFPGRQIFVNTMLPWPSATQAGLDSLNGLIRSNATAEGYTVVDWAADPTIGPQSVSANPTYYWPAGSGGLDGHPKDATYAIMATIAQSAGFLTGL